MSQQGPTAWTVRDKGIFEDLVKKYGTVGILEHLEFMLVLTQGNGNPVARKLGLLRYAIAERQLRALLAVARAARSWLDYVWPDGVPASGASKEAEATDRALARLSRVSGAPTKRRRP